MEEMASYISRHIVVPPAKEPGHLFPHRVE
jgi:hypothetical protein